jgi:MerR family redox-sensitive transcriptional activator SoxR
VLTIGEVAKRTGLAPSALRFYESKGLITAERTAGDQRRYHREVLRRIAFIRVAQRVGLTLEEIDGALRTLPADRAPTAKEWERLSTHWRGRLDEQIETLERLRDKLSDCIGCGCLSLASCRLYNPGDAAATLGPGPRYLLGDRPESVVRRSAQGPPSSGRSSS